MTSVKRLVDVSRALSVQRRLRTHDGWSRARLEQYQRERLAALIAYARARSPFYAERFRGISTTADVRLEELPVLTKSMMMAQLDRVFTDRALRARDLSSWIERVTGDDCYLDEYRVLTTGGSSGQKGIFVYGRREWSTALGGVLRWAELMGVRPRLLPRRHRVCSIGGDNPMHATYRAAATLDVGLHRILRLQATSRIEDLVRALNAFQPDVVNAYPSIAALLAVEQLEGRLDIHPAAVSTTSEVRTQEMARRMREAWGIVPFNYYAMTELMSFGSECAEHRGIHAYEDLFVFEVLDDEYRPVPPGTVGRRLLVTNFYNLTQPLIRYEVSDMIAAADEPCPCGRPYRLVTSIDGRSDDIVYLPDARGKPVPIHALHFYTAIEGIAEVKDFQVRQDVGGIDVCVALRGNAAREQVSRRISEELSRRIAALGAVLPRPVQVEVRDEIARDPRRMGKHKVVLSNVPSPRAAG